MSAPIARVMRRNINQIYQDRTLRVLVSPTPITFAERRAVLQVLQQHGPIDVFKMTVGYSSNFIAVARNAQDSQRLASASPLTYSVTIPRKMSEIEFADLSAPETIDQTKASVRQQLEQELEVQRPASLPSPQTKPPPFRSTDEVEEKKQFTLSIHQIHDYFHANTMANLAVHKSWPDHYPMYNTFASNTLRQSIPHNMATRGLAHWPNSTTDTMNAITSPKKERLALAKLTPSKMASRGRRQEAVALKNNG